METLYRSLRERKHCAYTPLFRARRSHTAAAERTPETDPVCMPWRYRRNNGFSMFIAEKLYIHIHAERLLCHGRSHIHTPTHLYIKHTHYTHSHNAMHAFRGNLLPPLPLVSPTHQPPLHFMLCNERGGRTMIKTPVRDTWWRCTERVKCNVNYAVHPAVASITQTHTHTIVSA